MIKKKYLVLLSMLLLIVFLGLSGNCYAYNYTVTAEDGLTIAKHNWNGTGTYYTSLYDNVTWAVNRVYQLGFDTCAIAMSNQSSYFYYVYGFNKADVVSISNSKNVNYMSVGFKPNTTCFRSQISSYRTASSWTRASKYEVFSSFQFGTGAQLSTQYLLISNDLGDNLFEGPWQSSEYIQLAPSDYFVFNLNQNLDSIDIDDDPVPLIDFQNNSANQVVLGYLDLAENFDYAELFTYRWYQNKWKLINIKRVDDVGTLQNDFINVILKGDDYLGDTLYSYQFNSLPDKDFENYSQPFYIKSKYTVITNGSLDIANTFSGDYYTNYNNDTNTQQVIGTLTDEEEEQQSLNELDNLFSGDINQLAEQFGYVDLADPVLGIFPSNIYNRLVEYMNDLTDVLLEEDPQTFTFYLHDNTGQIVLNTNDFITPAGPLKVFMQLFLITCTIFVVWNQFYRYYELLSTFNVVLLMHDLDVEKTVFRM